MKRYISSFLLFIFLSFNFSPLAYASNPVAAPLRSTYDLSQASPPQVKAALYAVMVGLGVAYVGVEGYQMVDNYMKTHDVKEDIKQALDGTIAVSKRCIKSVSDYLADLKTTNFINLGTSYTLLVNKDMAKIRALSGLTIPVGFKNTNVYNPPIVFPNFQGSTGYWFSDNTFGSTITSIFVYKYQQVSDSYRLEVTDSTGKVGKYDIGWTGVTGIQSLNFPLNYSSVVPKLHDDMNLGQKTWDYITGKGDFLVNPTYDVNDVNKTFDGHPVGVGNGAINWDNPTSIPWTGRVGALNPDGTFTDEKDLPAIDNPDTSVPTDSGILDILKAILKFLLDFLKGILTGILDILKAIFDLIKAIPQAIANVFDIPIEVDTPLIKDKITEKFVNPRFTKTWDVLKNMNNVREAPPKITFSLKALFSASTERFGVNNPFGDEQSTLIDFGMLQNYNFVGISIIDYFRGIVGMGFIITTFLYVWRKITPSDAIGG